MIKLNIQRPNYDDGQRKKLKISIGVLFAMAIICIAYSIIFAIVADEFNIGTLTVLNYVIYGTVAVIVIPCVFIIAKIEKQVKYNATQPICIIEKVSEEKK